MLIKLGVGDTHDAFAKLNIMIGVVLGNIFVNRKDCKIDVTFSSVILRRPIFKLFIGLVENVVMLYFESLVGTISVAGEKIVISTSCIPNLLKASTKFLT